YLLRLSVVGFLAWRAKTPPPSRVSRRRRDALFFLIPLATTLLIGFKVPLKIGFLTALPGMTRLVDSTPGDRVPRLSADQRCGIYSISASASARFGGRPRNEGRIIFILADDHEAGFIYSLNGIDDLNYNSGSAGHLFGNWYWMKED